MEHTIGRPGYEVVVEAVLDDRWVQWLGGHDLTYVDGYTVIGPIPDEAALYAVLATVRDFGLRLDGVRRSRPPA